MQPVIEMRKVTKAYRGVPAVKDVDFTLMKGEVHALLGENGAGKSTLTKIMAGVVAASSGDMLHNGQKVAFANPHEALQNGIAMVFQETSLVPSMTVAQNIYLGEEKFLNRLRGIYIAAQQFLQSLNFSVDPTATVAARGAAKRQMVEIARAVHHKADVIIFDEPTATLTPEEKRHFFALMRRLTADAMRAGAIGFATSRLSIHKTADGGAIPTFDADIAELEAITRGMGDVGAGTFQVVLDAFVGWDKEYRVIERVIAASGRPATFTLASGNDAPPRWRLSHSQWRGSRVTSRATTPSLGRPGPR